VARLVPVAPTFGCWAALTLRASDGRRPVQVLSGALLLLVVGAAAGLVRRSRRRADRSDARVLALETERAVVLRDERARLARELHDIVAHLGSIIAVQAGAAEPLVRERPADAEAALRAIRGSAGEAMHEMRRLLGVLRDDRGTPRPSVAGFERLLAETRAAGLEVVLRTEGHSRPLTPGVDLTLFRVVQEALTNARKHARGSGVEVLLRFVPEHVEVAVVDDGVGFGDGCVSGNGLTGMRERVSIHGGALDLVSRVSGGCGVRAVLPA
jgi:signal transduction histidine kinase